ncbi:MAG: dihydroorotate dehydrogenase electron transfer subunit [Bacteroidia bacterium]|nr:dihydroorotate dehydrogenase electron transfer subunit [Bacteroidia bacterium]
MRKTVQNLKVIANLRLNDDHHILRLQSADKLEQIHPGQFANLLVANSSTVFLRRPFSIYSVDYTLNTISVYIKIIGEGTRALSKAVVGSEIDTMFPLGNKFTLPTEKEKVLLVGGGSGVASLMSLAQSLHAKSNEVAILIGARSSKDLVELDEFSKFGTVYTTTEDGTQGVKGYVTNHPVLDLELSAFQRVYSCGPEPMMKAVAKKAKEKSIFCELSLENTMACGFGVCLCCITKTIDGHKCVCTEGPVFNINILKWEI